MKKTFRNTTLSITIAAGLAAAAWAPASLACSTEDYLGSVCATAFNYGSFSNQFVLADGRILQVSQNAALYSLMGTTFGGNGRETFALPDLRGRVIVGVGQGPGLDAITWGQKGGVNWSQLSIANLPQHNHGVSAVTVNTSNLNVTTTLSGLSGTLTVAVAPSPKAETYTSGAPQALMTAGSNPLLLPVTLSGNPSSTLTGTASAEGATDATGSGTAFSNMQPYLGLNYYIAVMGLYPSRD